MWVTPGLPGPSPEELEAAALREVELRHQNAPDVEEAIDPVEQALLAAADSDDRPGYSDFFYNPDDDEEVDEFADDSLFATSSALTEPHSNLTDPSHRGVLTVNVLGPVEVIGWVVPPRRKVLTELACYLALHTGRPVSGEEFRAALAGASETDDEVSAKSLRTYMSELRRCLGPGLLPEARTSGYGFSPGAITITDWATFQDLVLRPAFTGFTGRRSRAA